jgi:type II secretion system protein N
VGRLTRVALWVVGALLGIAAVALLIVNLYVQSQGTQAWIQQELSHRLGTTLRIRSVSVTPWGGLTLTGINIPQTSGTTGGDFLEAKSFHLHVRILPLFSQRLIIKEVSLLEPTVVWPQNSDGKWRLPGSHPAHETEGAEKQEMTTAPPMPNLPPPPETAAAPSPSAPEPSLASTAASSAVANAPRTFVPEVRRLNVTGGNFRFLDRSGDVVATFDGVRFHSNVRNSQAIRGGVSVSKISLRNRFFLQDLQSPLHYDPQELDLSKISARSGGGYVGGNFSIQPQSEDSPFTFNVQFRDVQADEIVTEAGGPKGVIQGKLEGSFEAAGKSADATALNGHGEIFLRDGKLQQYSLLVALGQVLQIEELTQLQLQQAEAKYHVTPGTVTIDALVLRSPNIRVSATGTVSFNGKLRLESELAINDKIRGQLFSPIRDNFQPINEPGYSAVDFQVSGTLDRPRTNLMEKLVGRNLKDFVSGILGGKKPDRPKRKKAGESEETSPSPPPDGNVSKAPADMPAPGKTPP